ncbi:O-antigen/teichoic acid export membrane protein [Cryobacterium sp. MP_M5]|uniref:flippase n=1 Tax=unclassified Cryobacterium TaxID=2649013 RepID=UPI0018CA52BA|nr:MULTISPECIES: flippase [unclassified Cryobacterium]MBG6057004.1 O-antigen/teichoic acid export membrane protein [Cryobacterium sp. MP_M3]MEC5175203.1 O-antigen/teichoic acid export membrane protein [Cryobacterium sp. MP_M5]
MSARRGIYVATLGNLIPPLAALVTAPVLAQGLGVAGRGEVAAATAPLILASTILTLGVPESFTYYVARNAARLGKHVIPGLAILLISGLAGSGVIAVFASPLSGGNQALSLLILIATTSLVPALLVTGLRGIAAGQQLWRRIALERSCGAILRMVTVVVLLLAGNLTPLTGTIALSVSTFVGGFIYLLPPVTSPGRLSREGGEGRSEQVDVRLLGYGGRVWLGSLAGILLMRVDQLLMTPLSSATQLGLYAVAVSISELILIFNSAVRDVLFSLESKSPNASRIGQATRLSTLVTVVLGVFVAALSPWAIPTFFGSDFSGSISVTIVLLVAVIVGNPGSIAGAGLSGRGRPELRSTSLVIGLVFNVALIVFLVPHIGALGAAVATLIGNFISGNLNVVWMRRYFSVPMADSYGLRRADILVLRQALAWRPRIARTRPR